MSLNLQYEKGIKTQIVNAFRSVYRSPNFPDQEMARKINVELEYPIIQERYPAIYITWNATRPIQDMGLGNYTIENSSAGKQLFRQWLFEGSVGLNIMALDPLERDMLAASVMDIMAFGKDVTVYKPFRNKIYDEEFVSLQLLTQSVTDNGGQVSPSPWGNRDEFVYIKSYSLVAVGSFISEPSTGDLIRISNVRSYPYKPDDPLPAGSLDSQDISIPWEPL